MTEFKKIFLDTSPVIYLLDKNVNESLKNKTQRVLSFLYDQTDDPKFLMSTITCEEYLVIPYRMNDKKAVDSLWYFISDINVIVQIIDMEIALKAAQIRAKYKFFKTMDAMQLATACIQGCDLFLTNDKQLTQFDEINCSTIAEWQFDI